MDIARHAPWSQCTDEHTVNRRAGGRRAYNARRKLQAAHRRLSLARGFTFRQGDVARFAREFGVHRTTIYRDLRALGVGPGWQQVSGQRTARDRGRLACLLARMTKDPFYGRCQRPA
jgi:hypothetical protein